MSCSSKGKSDQVEKSCDGVNDEEGGERMSGSCWKLEISIVSSAKDTICNCQYLLIMLMLHSYLLCSQLLCLYILDLAGNSQTRRS